MTKIYVKNTDIKIFEKLCKKFPKIQKNDILILSKRGIYKIVNDELFLYKLRDKQNLIIDNKYIITDFYWRKLKNPIMTIPYEHHVLKISKEEYKITDDIQFVFEKNTINDFYFQTKNTNIEKVINEISSFLSNSK